MTCWLLGDERKGIQRKVVRDASPRGKTNSQFMSPVSKPRPSSYSKRKDKPVIITNINYTLLHDLILYLEQPHQEGIFIILLGEMRTPRPRVLQELPKLTQVANG